MHAFAVAVGYFAVGWMSSQIVAGWAEREGRRLYPELYRTQRGREWCRQNDRPLVVISFFGWPVALPLLAWLCEPWKGR